MTGYGRGEARSGGVTALVEVRSVNSRFLEVVSRLPRSLSLRENEIKEFVRKKIVRGKVSVVGTIERTSDVAIPLRVNVPVARGYYRLLNDLRKAVKSKEPVKLEHLLKFSEVIDQEGFDAADDDEWTAMQSALDVAINGLVTMRQGEGSELMKDLEQRIHRLTEMVGRAEGLSKEQLPVERARLRERVEQLMEKTMDEGRLEMEVVLLADRLDITEECVRFRSHNKFFLEAFAEGEAAGRKLNFLVQEMNREANTIGSKSASGEIAHLVVRMKEELEKIREQLQNVE
jgi:uncharacterized protein (TIGR00255 family)